MKILAYCVHGTLSYSILRHVAAELERRGCEVRWQFAASNLLSSDETSKLVSERGLKLRDSDFKPDLAIHADPRCPPKVECPVVEVPHGLASKIGYYLPDIEMRVDFHLAVSDWFASRIRSWHPHVKTFTVGMPKLDPFFSRTRLPSHIVYAPTFTRTLNCWPAIEAEAVRIAESAPSLLRLHRVQTEKVGIYNPQGIEVDTGLDICDALARARVLVSDTSSAFLEAMAVGIPVICYLTPGAKGMLAKHPDSVENEFIKHALVISDPGALRLAINMARPAPLEVQERLLSYRGTAAARAAEVICELC